MNKKVFEGVSYALLCLEQFSLVSWKSQRAIGKETVIRYVRVATNFKLVSYFFGIQDAKRVGLIWMNESKRIYNGYDRYDK